uniref:Uncharacterized protein n=1 Tax=Sphaerodactylus townsendi TaxID=933632 RepID=A0ACB8FM47_9SAUR
MASVAEAGEPSSVTAEASAPLEDPAEKLTLEILEGCLCSLPDLLGQLNLGDDVVKINIDWSKFQHTPPPQPMLLLSVLQQHISDLQLFVEKLQSLIKEKNVMLTEDSSKAEGKTGEANSNVTEKDAQMEVQETACASGSSKEAHVDFNPEVVQIKARKAEIDRRISAFIERKQAEINENNVREFCNVIDCNQGGPVPKDIYQRIKKLEDKILELEGMSPEYFQSANYSLVELDEKIRALKQTLLQKTNEERPKVVDELL